MGADKQSIDSYSKVKQRLDEIANSVADENMPLDDALDLYEEAVKLAMRASELIEIDEGSSEGESAEQSSEGESVENASSQE